MVGAIFATLSDMNKLLLSLTLAITLTGFGCVPKLGVPPDATGNTKPTALEPDAVLPIAGYASRRTYKSFGEYISDRFRGYHVGDDVEYDENKEDVPVVAIAAGKVRKFGRTSGYGGLAVIEHKVGNETVNALYGHLDLKSSNLKEGDAVERGQFIANLGDSQSAETDGERKHLHFALYQGDDLRVNGYEPKADGVKRWLNPTDFFLKHNVKLEDYSRAYNPARDLGGNTFKVRFAMPGGTEVEYIPELPALNLFTLRGEGSARERSVMLIRYFDANKFTTLSSVTIYETKNVTAGGNKYDARRYDIEKKPGVADFAYQPSWRNARHIVTDFASRSGSARYYVVAENPKLASAVYEAVLASMQVVD